MNMWRVAASLFTRFAIQTFILTSLITIFAYVVISLRANPAYADAYVRMHDNRKVAVGPNGLKVVITTWGEHAIITRSITNNGLTRFAEVSENIQAVTNLAALSDTSAGVSSGLQAGYLIGCQFPESGAQINAQLQINVGMYLMGLYPTVTLGVSTPPSVEGSVYPTNISLTPGSISRISFPQMSMNNGSAVFQISDYELPSLGQGDQGPNSQVPCAGYAAARSFAAVTINSGMYALNTNLYGQAFGIG